MFFLLIIYGSLELITLRNHGNSTITKNAIDSYFNDTYEFDIDKKPGFQIAFGITTYDSNYEMIDEPEFAEIKMSLRYWSPETNGTQFTLIEAHPCTEEELGLAGQEKLD